MEIVIGAAVFAAGILAGRLLPRRRAASEDPKPVCACSHPRSFHDSDGCHGTVERSGWQRGRWMGIQQDPCPCQAYEGPQPLPRFYAPELSIEENQERRNGLAGEDENRLS